MKFLKVFVQFALLANKGLKEIGASRVVFIPQTMWTQLKFLHLTQIHLCQPLTHVGSMAALLAYRA